MSPTQFFATWLLDCLNVALLWSGGLFWILMAREGLQRLRRWWKQRHLLEVIRRNDSAGI